MWYRMLWTMALLVSHAMHSNAQEWVADCPKPVTVPSAVQCALSRAGGGEVLSVEDRGNHFLVVLRQGVAIRFIQVQK